MDKLCETDCMSDWIGPAPRSLSELAAFDAMKQFLEAFWERGRRESEDIALMLSFLSRDVLANGMPADPAMWSDWRAAVDKVVVPEADLDPECKQD